MEYLVTTGADTERITYINYVIQFITTFSYAPAKSSVSLLVLRIIGPIAVRQGMWHKWLIYITLILVWIATIVNCVMTYAQCTPVKALWNQSVEHKCWDPELEPHFAILTGSEYSHASPV